LALARRIDDDAVPDADFPAGSGVHFMSQPSIRYPERAIV
jgi:hypothetical protein